MRKEPNVKVEQFRVGGPPGTNCGNFIIPCRSPGATAAVKLTVVASDGAAWDHVSVSAPLRTPTWEELEFIRNLFFRDDECVMQLSVPRAEHINVHDYVLHLWRPQTAEEVEDARARYEAAREYYPEPDAVPGPIPRPPSFMV